jgi:WD40 repeat protein
MLEKLDLNLPEVIYFIRTEGGWCTRQNAIVGGVCNEWIFVHEMFHIFSRYNPAIRDELYSILGYHPCGAPIKYPDSVVRITNPDAPVTEHYIVVRYRGEPLTVAPIYYSKSETYTGGGLFDYIQYGLMAVEESSEGWTYKLVNGEPLILKESDVEGYWEQVGRNTDYDIHPEERMAENFNILCSGRPGHYWNLQTPRIIEEMDALLAGPREYPEIVKAPLREFTDSRASIESIQFSEDGSEILTCSTPYSNQAGDAIITTWDAATGLQLDTFSVNPADASGFSPHGTYLLQVIQGDITIWDIENQQPLYTLQHPEINVSGARREILYIEPSWAFSPDETEILIYWRYGIGYESAGVVYETTSGSTEATLRDTVTGLELMTLPTDYTWRPPVYTPDGSQVLIGGCLYNTTTGREVKRFEPWVPYAEVFSPDGTRFLSTVFVAFFISPRGSVQLSDAATGEGLRSFAFVYGCGVFSPRFSPDGKFILTVSVDNTATLWNETAEKEIGVFQHPEGFRDAIFSPDGNYILTKCDDGIVRLWDISDLVEPTAVDQWQLY